MDQNLMALLATVLSGQKQSSPMAMAQPQPAQPMMPAPQMQASQQPMAARNPQGGQLVRPQMYGGRPGEHGNDPGMTPGTGPGDNNGGGKDGNGGKGGGKGNNLSWFEQKMREIANKGPKAYPKYMEKNIGAKEITPGYGKADPSASKTGMANSLANVLTGGPINPPPVVEGPGFPTWPKV